MTSLYVLSNNQQWTTGGTLMSKLWECARHRGSIFLTSRILCATRSRVLFPVPVFNPDRIRRVTSSTRSLENSDPSQAVKLRSYQQDAIDAVLSYLAEGEKRLGLSLATGSGKTVVFSSLIEQVSPPNASATQTLILAHRRELIEQAARHCRKLYPNKTIDIEMGNQHASGTADITVASVQSIISKDRLFKYDPARFKLVVVDEAHHIVSSSYTQTLRHFGLIDNDQPTNTALVGVSATFSRFDGVQLGAAIDHIVYHKDYVEMIDEKWLSNVAFTTVRSGADLSRVSTTKGDFQTSSLSRAVNTDGSNDIVVRTWIHRAADRKSTLVFCVDIAHVEALTAKFQQHGLDARFVTGSTPTKIRYDLLESFKNGKFPILLNCGIFTEGTDIPNIDCIILARPTKSRNLLIQMLGRGLRLHSSKKDCHVIDMVSTLDTGIVTTPTLFGLDPKELVENAGTTQLQSLKEQRRNEAAAAPATNASRKVPGSTSLEFSDYDSVHDLIEDTSGERHIRTLSPNAWVAASDTRWILSSTSGDFLTVQRDDGGGTFKVSYTYRLPPATSGWAKSPYGRPRVIASQMATVAEAVRAADSFVGSRPDKWPREMTIWRAKWRGYPASEQQLAFLNKFRDEDNQLEASEVTKGQAMEWITKLKHGAKKRFQAMQVTKRKHGRVEKQRQRFEDANAQVTVGPVNSQNDEN